MFSKTKIKIIKGDITKVGVDIIVNAANKSLLGGGGVDGAIHMAAGSLLVNECETLNGCEVGQVKYTKAYNLNAKWIIHTVGPVWYHGLKNETENLAQCYINTLNLAVKLKSKTIAFPNISTGVYRFPKRLAARIAISEIKKFIVKNNYLTEIVIVNYEEDNFNIYKEMLDS